MKIDFENLGNIEKGSIELNDFTLFCGKNNSGKTYAMYSIYGLLSVNFRENFSQIFDIGYIDFDFVKTIVDKLEQDREYSLSLDNFLNLYKKEMLDVLAKRLELCLPILFGVTKDNFSQTRIQLNFSDENIKERIKQSEIKSYRYKRFSLDIDEKEIQFSLANEEKLDGNTPPSLQLTISGWLIGILFFDWYFSQNPFLLPAERAGINLLLKELFSVRNLAIQQAQNDNANAMRLLNEIIKARYAEPLKDYMQYINSISGYQKEDSSYRQYAEAIQHDVLGGVYEVDEFNNIFFIPSDSKNKLPLHFSSSTVKTQFGLVFYLQHQAKKGDCLMIDEPELNLHPDNQRKVARVLAQLVNAGLKVIVSTHSDYFVRELNNLIMLRKDFTGAKSLQKKYGYADNELLDGKRVSAYLFDDKKITQMTLDEDEGIVAETFDDVINTLSESSNEIYYTMQDAKGV